MSHRNARLTVHGRRLLVQRVRELGMPVAHVAKAMGISRQCAHRWVARFDAEGDAGLHDRSSRPHLMPTRTSAEVEARIVAARLEHRRGPDWLGPELGVPARTVSRVLRRHDLPRLCTLDPLTGQPIRATRHTTKRYERERPGELVHVDVKKIGRIPDGGGWRAHGRQMGSTSAARRPRSATTTSTTPSTTTSAWPTPRSSPTRRARPAPASSPAPQRSSPHTGSPRSNG